MPRHYHEIVVKGDDKLLKGFLWGYRAAKHARGLYWAHKVPIATHHLREILQGHGDYEHIVCSAMQHKSLVAAIEQSEPALKIKVISDKVVHRAHFRFKFETFSPKVGATLKRMFSRVPAFISLSEFDPHEKVTKEAEGVEMYSVAHHYIYKGEGIAEGDLAALLKYHERLHEHEFVDVKDINLECAP